MNEEKETYVMKAICCNCSSKWYENITKGCPTYMWICKCKDCGCNNVMFQKPVEWKND